MAVDTTVAPTTDSKFEAEPIPDNIADTELNGLQPAEESTDSKPVEAEQDETNDDQPTAPDETPEGKADDVEEPGETEAEEAEPTEEEVAPTTEQLDAPELSGLERRLAEKAARDNFIQTERQKIRDYEQQIAPDDVAKRIEVMEAKQYVDTVERNQMAVRQDMARAKSEIPFFASKTPQAEAAYQQAIQNYANAYGQVDPDTNAWLGAADKQGNEVPLLPYLEQQAAMYEQIIASTRQTAQKAEQKMRSKAVNPSNPGKVSSSGDDMADLLDRIGDVNLTHIR
jgi:hypothetical protein